MKKNKIIATALVMSMLVIPQVFQTSKIITHSKDYYSANNDKVSTRELAMLASIVYEDVPDDSRYVGSTANQGCNVDMKTGEVTKGQGNKCHYVALEENTSKDVRLKGSKYNVWQYIEGLSNRKIHSVVSLATSAFEENGQKYYWLNYADVTELDNWEIVHKESQETSRLKNAVIDFDWDGTFDAMTFKKGNNYVIAYRGTDYPDLYEWLQDVGYALTGEHDQARLAYNYAQSEYERIIDDNPNAKIYVTGHSLGAYLAQVGGAAIVDKANNRTNPDETPRELSTLDNYKTLYKNSAPNLVQVAYFNGMGVGGIFTSSNFTKNIDNALIYLSTHSSDGNVANTGRYVNYSSDDKTKVGSSGRLVLYSMDGDPISNIGLHYGEIFKLEVGADAITNHHETHNAMLGETVGQGIEKFLKLFAPKSKEEFSEKDKQEIVNAQKTSEFSDFVVSLSDNLYKTIMANQKVDGKFTYLPSFVSKTIEEETGKLMLNYGLPSLLHNLTKDVDTFSTKHKGFEIKNVFDHFNMNHETDSFVCIRDEANGIITPDKIKVEVDSDKFNCIDGVCYTNKNITLKARVEHGCAKKYTWYYSTDGNTFSELGTTEKNTYEVPLNEKADKNGNFSGYFKVAVTYGDNFQTTKLGISDSNLTFEYNRKGDTYSSNPTIAEDAGKKRDSQTVTSNDAVKVAVVYDAEAPTCELNKTQNVGVDYKKIWGIKNYKDTAATSVLRCTDSLSGFNENNTLVDFTNFSMDENTGIGLDIVSLNRKGKVSKSINGKNMDVRIPIIVHRLPSKYTATLKYTGGIKDLAGNSAQSQNNKLTYNVTLGNQLN